jgi:HD domain
MDIFRFFELHTFRLSRRENFGSDKIDRINTPRLNQTDPHILSPTTIGGIMPIRIPCSPDIVLADGVMNVLPIWRSALFQRLRSIRQFGHIAAVFLGGTHTRIEHMLGTFALAKEQTMRWYHEGRISMTEVVMICMFALLHDIGHYPFSHALEPILDIDHHANGIAIIRMLASELAECGVSAEALIAYMNEVDPLAAAVSHGILGFDKLDYLRRDAWHTGWGGFPETTAILSCTLPFEGKIVLRHRAAFEAERLAAFKISMYARLYQCSSIIYASRVVQKIYLRLEELGAVNRDKIALMTDAQLETVFGTTDDAIVSRLYETYRGVNEPPKTGVLFCRRGYGLFYHRNEDPNRIVVELENGEFEQLSRKATWKNALAIESRIAETLGTKTENIYLQPARSRKTYLVPETDLLNGNVVIPLSAVVNLDAYEQEAGRYQVIRVGTNDNKIFPGIGAGNAEIRKIILA